MRAPGPAVVADPGSWLPAQAEAEAEALGWGPAPCAATQPQVTPVPAPGEKHHVGMWLNRTK